MEDVRHVEAGRDGGDRAKPVDDADPERRHQAGPGGRRVVFLPPGEDQKDQAKDAGEVDAAMQGLLQQPEAGRVVVKTREPEQQGRDDPAGHGKQWPESHLWIEFELKLLDLGVVEVYGCRHAGSANRAMSSSVMSSSVTSRSKGTPAISAGRLPCRIFRHPDAAECRRRGAQSPSGSPCPWRGRNPAQRASCRSRAPW